LAGKGRGPGTGRKHVPLRTCIACHQERAKRDLIRIVHTPEGQIEIDPKGKRSGRGAYLCYDRACWDVALKQSSLGRALKCEVSPEQVAELRSQLELSFSKGQTGQGDASRLTETRS
jgi:uncharacterized protein